MQGFCVWYVLATKLVNELVAGRRRHALYKRVSLL